MKQASKLHNWLQTELEKDKRELEVDKSKIIKELIELKKEDLFKKQEKTYSFWTRIKKLFS